ARRAVDRSCGYGRHALGADVVRGVPLPRDDPRARGSSLGPLRGRGALMAVRRFAGGGGMAVLVGALAATGLLLPVSEALILENAVGVILFAVATNLLLGYGGLVSFGQAAFYGSGAYTVTLGWRH